MDEDIPTLSFKNEGIGNDAVKRFAERSLLRFVQEDLRRLENMVCQILNFPRLGVQLRHVLNIAEQAGGLQLCTTLLQAHLAGDWAQVNAIACCEAGGFIFASALAFRVGTPLALIREAGKLPPPTASVVKSPSHVSSPTPHNGNGTTIETVRDIFRKCKSVVVVDDVLTTGKTLCAVLRLLGKAGVASERISVTVVAEFAFHRGRELLRQNGFGRVAIDSLLVFSGA
ncbi:phosphoribosyl transferase [Akanthomyces lecanii RCEF 1005]|uniref:adenine phosphoribosyltransferase n=1 Tax=Akanthomyces lecanii RCEF 1005 TaxID=1081108 RepID=A0A162KP46_CORDF|nr:phosphoribosyl transferase [Akanthomyces lecanii RCEF 1005]